MSSAKISGAGEAHLATGDAAREDAADVGVPARLQRQALDDAVDPLLLEL
jgi:hypothetical protein